MNGFADSESFQRWWQEHSELDGLVRAVEARMGRGSLARTSQALEELEAALDAHFTVEERVYFPLIEKLSPERHTYIRAARDGHLGITALLDELRDLVECGELAEARRALAKLLDRFRDHEIQEAKLIEDLEALECSARD